MKWKSTNVSYHCLTKIYNESKVTIFYVIQENHSTEAILRFCGSSHNLVLFYFSVLLFLSTIMISFHRCHVQNLCQKDSIHVIIILSVIQKDTFDELMILK